MRRRQLLVPAFCILHAALLLSLVGCGAKAKAESLPDGPPLAVPVAPVHEIVIERIAEAPPPEPEPAPEPVPPAPRPAVAQTPVRTAPPRTETPAPPTEPVVVTPPPPETATVRAAPVAGSATEANVKQVLAKADSDLQKRVDYRKLSPEGRAQYEQSKRFADEARAAMKERNFVYALTLAEKAATLAAELAR